MLKEFMTAYAEQEDANGSTATAQRFFALAEKADDLGAEFLAQAMFDIVFEQRMEDLNSEG